MEKTRREGMIYRKLGKTDIDISALSFGTMRWTSEESCFEAVQRGLDAGMNYFDTSTGYVGGMSEVWTGKAVRSRRGEALVSSKSQYGKAPNEPAVRGAIENSLKRMGLDYFDFYQLWGLSSMGTLKSALAKGGFLDGVRRAMKDSLIRRGVGFTFHGTPEVFRAAVDTGEFLSATVSYNLMKRTEEENIRYASDRGVGIFVMNPLGGGVLGMAGDEGYGFLNGRSGGTWYGAIRYLLANAGVTAALMGFSGPAQVEADLEALEGGAVPDEPMRREMERMMDAVQLIDPGFCTGCRYCEVCENGFSPSKLMQALRGAKLYRVKDADMEEWMRSAYVHDLPPEEQLAKCIECGLCMEKCPQKLKIVEEIQSMKGLFGIKH
jgi:predicted aldo/keto reductase-like oxidoreductase